MRITQRDRLRGLFIVHEGQWVSLKHDILPMGIAQYGTRIKELREGKPKPGINPKYADKKNPAFWLIMPMDIKNKTWFCKEDGKTYSCFGLNIPEKQQEMFA